MIRLISFFSSADVFSLSLSMSNFGFFTDYVRERVIFPKTNVERTNPSEPKVSFKAFTDSANASDRPSFG